VETCRIDKWLWSTRLYKTRTLATSACKAGKVKIKDSKVKPSRMVAPGEVIIVRKDGITRTLQVLAPLDKRVGAKFVHEYLKDLTPQEELDSARERSRAQGIRQPQGTGRPTKRRRRLLDRFFGKMKE